jgi:hypothetical protein
MKMQHSESIYINKKNNRILNPFSFHVDPMERLLLVNFENDPDTIYKGFEPQYFDDDIHGKGLLVIGWRNDMKVDVYHEKGLKLQEKTYDIAGKGLDQMVESNFESAVFEIMDAGVHADIVFKDKMGRKVEIRILEQHPEKREPFGLLAPMGDAAESPSAMPLVYVHDFYFVRRKHTEFSITIDGKHHKPDKFPIPLDGMWMFFTRYSGDPFIVTFNPAMIGKVDSEEFADKNLLKKGDTELELTTNGPALEIKKFVKRSPKHEIQLVFEPPFPQLNLLKESVDLSGKFFVKSHDSTGRIDGTYQVQRNKTKVFLVLEPTEGWIPNESKATVRFLYAVVKMFRHWPKTYRWTAELKQVGGSWELKSDWKRLK